MKNGVKFNKHCFLDSEEQFNSNIFDQCKIICKYLSYSDLRQQNLGFGGMLMKIFERIVNEDDPPKR